MPESDAEFPSFPKGYAGNTDFGMVVTCEHGGKRIPPRYRALFRGQQALLDSHRGYDPGALVMARALAEHFNSPLVTATVSRLLVDLNRSIGHPRLHCEVVRKSPTDLRREILVHYYQPYRTRAADVVAEAIAKYGRVLHISSHSFTPELNGKQRKADIGLLYDPARTSEAALCSRWQEIFMRCAPAFTVRRNYPYAGKGDGLTRWFRQRYPPEVYVGVELEVNQKYVFHSRQQWHELRRVIIDSLGSALSSDLRGPN